MAQSFLLILAVGCLFSDLCVILQALIKEVMPWRKVEITFSAIPQRSNLYSFNLNCIFRKLVLNFILVHENNTLLWGMKMSVVFLLLFKKNCKIDLPNYKTFLHFPEIKSKLDQVSAMVFFYKNSRSITWLFSQEVLSWVFECASSVSAFAISLKYGCLW